jgi:hypothetical protein
MAKDFIKPKAFTGVSVNGLTLTGRNLKGEKTSSFGYQACRWAIFGNVTVGYFKGN